MARTALDLQRGHQEGEHLPHSIEAFSFYE